MTRCCARMLAAAGLAVWLAAGCEPGRTFTEIKPDPPDVGPVIVAPDCMGEFVDPDGLRLGIPLVTVGGLPVAEGADIALDTTAADGLGAAVILIEVHNAADLSGGALMVQHVWLQANLNATGQPWLTCTDPTWGGDCASPYRQVPAPMEARCRAELPDHATFELHRTPGPGPQVANLHLTFVGAPPGLATMQVVLRIP